MPAATALPRAFLALAPVLVLVLVVGGLAACGQDGSHHADPAGAPVDRFVGEIHLHQFPLGSHPWAGFLAETVPSEHVHSDQLVEYEPEPLARSGACALYAWPSCDPPCGAGTLCMAGGTCAALVPLRFVDGGEVRVTGSRVQPLIRMWFDRPETGYLTDPPAGSAQLFAGGERLRIDGGRDGYRIGGEVPAPRAVVVRAPDLAGAVRLAAPGAPDAPPLEIRWDAEAAEKIVVKITASRDDGQAAWIRCVTADAGRLDVPAAMIARLPPLPRFLHLELERDEERVLVTAAGEGVSVHAAQSSWKRWAEE